MRIEADDPERDWTIAGVYEVFQDLYRIPLPLPTDGLKAVNVYAMRDGDGLVLIDSGWSLDEARAVLDKASARSGTGSTRCDRFLITHVHRDHYTLAVAAAPRVRQPDQHGHRRAAVAARDDQTGAPPLRTTATKLRRCGAMQLADALRRGSEAPDRGATGRTRTTGWNRRARSRCATAACGRCPPRATPRATWFRRLGPQRDVRRRPRAAAHHPVDRVGGAKLASRRCGTTWARCAWCVAMPDRVCCRHTAGVAAACTRGWTSCSPTTRSASMRWPKWWDRREHRLPGGAAGDLDPARPPVRRAGFFQQLHGHLRDRRSPGCARRAGSVAARGDRRGAALPGRLMMRDRLGASPVIRQPVTDQEAVTSSRRSSVLSGGGQVGAWSRSPSRCSWWWRWPLPWPG